MSDNDLRATGYKSGQNKVLGGGEGMKTIK